MFNFFQKSDSQIQQDVINEIKWDQSIQSSSISVTTHDGVVTLRGNVPHYYEKTQSEAAAQRVGGVRAVVDEIEVNIMGSYERSDEQIAEAVLNALKWNYSVPKDTIKVIVEKGKITLKGEVEWDYQRTAAKSAVSDLMGVSSVINNILIKNKNISKPAEIRSFIESALKRSAEGEGRNISVKINGDKAILSGNVHSFSEIDVANQAAWMAPGIMSVENNITISQ